MPKNGTKRAEGKDVEKDAFEEVEVSDEDAQKLAKIQGDVSKVEVILEREAFKRLQPIYEKRRSIYKSIAKFWPATLFKHAMFEYHVQHKPDVTALSYLEDLWVERDTIEPRCYTLEFHFAENPFFSDPILKKEYKLTPASGEQPDADGLTPTMLDFVWERDVTPGAMKINWKDDSKNLTKLFPRIKDEADDFDDLPADTGSFFNFFEQADDPFDLGNLLANDIYPEATEYFLGTNDADADSEEDNSDDDDSEQEEIDLVSPKKQKRK